MSNLVPDELPKAARTLALNERTHKQSELCRRCDGTGNETVNIYTKCQLCGGTGLKPTPAPERSE